MMKVDGTETHEYSASYTYNSQSDFENSFWGSGDYYPIW
jgi:hypothetical protein